MARRPRYIERSIKRIEAYKYLEANGYDDFHKNAMAVYLAYMLKWAGEQPVTEDDVEDQAARIYYPEKEPVKIIPGELKTETPEERMKRKLAEIDAAGRSRTSPTQHPDTT